MKNSSGLIAIGIFFGITLSVVFYIVFGVEALLDKNLAIAFVGALLGSFLTLLSAIYLREVEASKEIDAKAEQVVLKLTSHFAGLTAIQHMLSRDITITLVDVETYVVRADPIYLPALLKPLDTVEIAEFSHLTTSDQKMKILTYNEKILFLHRRFDELVNAQGEAFARLGLPVNYPLRQHATQIKCNVAAAQSFQAAIENTRAFSSFLMTEIDYLQNEVNQIQAVFIMASKGEALNWNVTPTNQAFSPE